MGCLSSKVIYRYDSNGVSIPVCSRCHRPEHTSLHCFENSYADGSPIGKYCVKCKAFHNKKCIYDNNLC